MKKLILLFLTVFTLGLHADPYGRVNNSNDQQVGPDEEWSVEQRADAAHKYGPAFAQRLCAIIQIPADAFDPATHRISGETQTITLTEIQRQPIVIPIPQEELDLDDERAAIEALYPDIKNNNGSITQQQERANAVIAFMMERYGLTGELPLNLPAP